MSDDKKCNCKADLEAKLLERFKEHSPEATEHGVSLQGYTLLIEDNRLRQAGYMTAAASALYPLKKGGTKLKKITQNMIFTFCPFCGEKY